MHLTYKACPPSSGLLWTETHFSLEFQGAQAVWGSVTLLPYLRLLPSVGLISPSGGKDALAAVGLRGPSTR